MVFFFLSDIDVDHLWLEKEIQHATFVKETV
jgi:hypothetical protein